MKRTIILFLTILTLQTSAQESAIMEIPETYELSNIILALTDYGITDEWEVQKKTDYYNKIMDYFEPVKDHPLLDSVNYSREKWDYYLAFRTDAVAYSFDEKSELVKNYEFSTQPGLNPFGSNIALINDFVQKSGFRKFYTENKAFYDRLINNYQDYNFVNEMIAFLDKNIGKQEESSTNSVYKVILSPLVYRMNCHRQLQENVVADFPSATENFINGVSSDENLEDRLNSNHLIFTEKDHEYINPITLKYVDLVKSNFNPEIWDNNSGHKSFNSFNEYLTWAVYDLFLEERFPEYAKSLSTQWQYQNASRGFFAQNLFSEKVKELYYKNKDGKFEHIYEPLLKWVKKIENNVTLPTFADVDGENFVKTDINNIQVNFSERMDPKQPFGIKIMEYGENKYTGNVEFVEITDFKWTNKGKTLNFKIDTKYKKFALLFNWWGIEKPLISKSGIFLKPSSYLLLEK